MFTGIIETTGKILSLDYNKGNLEIQIASKISSQLKKSQSLSHDGVCLTVTKCNKKSHWVTAVKETLVKSNLSFLKKGQFVNLERCMKANGRFDGHIVQGHVDTVATCMDILNNKGSREYVFGYDKSFSGLIVDKGSIALNGISLTIVKAKQKHFTIAIVPYTFNNTTFKTMQMGDKVNVEFDILGKYILNLINIKQ